MRRNTLLAAIGLSMLAWSSTYAQCNRGSRGGANASASITPLLTSGGLSSQIGPFNSISSSPNMAYLAALYRSQLARQRYQLDQQQRYLRAMAQRQRRLQSQRLPSPSSNLLDAAPGEGSNPANARRERTRHENAERAFDLAQRAEMAGRVSLGKKNYRKVVRVLGDSESLGRRATDALNELNRGQRHVRSSGTLLAPKTK